MQVAHFAADRGDVPVLERSVTKHWQLSFFCQTVSKLFSDLQPKGDLYCLFNCLGFVGCFCFAFFFFFFFLLASPFVLCGILPFTSTVSHRQH